MLSSHCLASLLHSIVIFAVFYSVADLSSPAFEAFAYAHICFLSLYLPHLVVCPRARRPRMYDNTLMGPVSSLRTLTFLS